MFTDRQGSSMTHLRLSMVCWGFCHIGLTIAVGNPYTQKNKPQEQWIAVVAPALRQVVEPLCEHRRDQGMKVVVLDTPEILKKKENREEDASKIREKIGELCRKWSGQSYVLLVGSATSKNVSDPVQFTVPTLKGTVERMKGEPTDNGYGCLNKELTPTIAVGRFPARTIEEARAMVKKTLSGEKSAQPGLWKRRVTILAGNPLYNPTVDALIENIAMSFIGRIKPTWSGRAIYHNPNSLFNLMEHQIRKQAIAYLSEGQVIAVYLGHSKANGFWHGWQSFKNGDQWLPHFGRKEWANVKIGNGPCILATFGCHGCQLDGKNGEGYGLYAMRNPAGPVAVIGAHGPDFSAMAMLITDGLLINLPDHNQAPRLGKLWLKMKKHLAGGWINPIYYHTLDAVDGDPDVPQARQRLEHLEMFLLLGDPAFRLPAIPEKIKLEVDGQVTAGSKLTIRGRIPDQMVGSRGQLTLKRPLNSKPTDIEHLPPKVTIKQRIRITLANHQRANQFILKKVQLQTDHRTFETEVILPSTLPWPKLILRVYLATKTTEGMGVHVLNIQHRQEIKDKPET
ncbi:MAG: C25 family cysteine peptidase [Planctomycetota bacterium]|jgi:hypothetical protein